MNIKKPQTGTGQTQTNNFFATEATENTEAPNKNFLRGVQGGSFFKKRPPGRRRQHE
jgi:hypothetical protein